MRFASDNWAGASPRVRDALLAATEGFAKAYGGDETTQALTSALSRLFERDVAVFVVPTGTAANALSLSAASPPNGAILAHAEAHVVGDEYGAPEFYTQGAKIIPIPGIAGKLAKDDLEGVLTRLRAARHGIAPAALSLTQATECGTVYSVEEIASLAGAAKAAGLTVHMDGARFANAVASLGTSPAGVTWKAGIDVLSFGGSKNGALMAEAVVVFEPRLAEGVEWRRRRGGHVLSKARLISSQFLALIADGHWLELAGHANAMAKRLGEGLAAAGHRIPWPVQANEVFPVLPQAVAAKLRQEGAFFHDWSSGSVKAEDQPGAGETMVRLVASFATTPAEVDRLVELAG